VMHPTPAYTLTDEKRLQISSRLEEMIRDESIKPELAIKRCTRAIDTVFVDDYSMGRKEGYIGRYQNRVEHIFGTREKFQGWLHVWGERKGYGDPIPSMLEVMQARAAEVGSSGA
jgi:hypothetical protein